MFGCFRGDQRYFVNVPLSILQSGWSNGEVPDYWSQTNASLPLRSKRLKIMPILKRSLRIGTLFIVYYTIFLEAGCGQSPIRLPLGTSSSL